jgi:membrane-bound serine protease (ClpP class)
MNAFYPLAWSIIIVFVAVIIGIKYIPRSGLWKRLVLATSQIKEEGYRADSAGMQNYLGKTGKTVTILRPSGRALFGEEALDVITEGEFIDKGEQVKVVKVDGNRIVVAKWS